MSFLQLKSVELQVAKDKNILKNINFSLNKGDFLVVVGGNGSGKSSLMKVMNRQYHATKGSVLLEACDIQQFSFLEFSKKVVTLNQSIHQSLFMDLTLEENALLLEMSFNPRFNKKKVLSQIKTELELYHPKLIRALKMPIHSLSGGEQQILAFILYLRRNPTLLLLDEHTSALDPKTAAMMMTMTAKIIAERQLTCVMITHSLADALQYGNCLLSMKDGEINYSANTTQKSALSKKEVIELCY